MGAICCDSRFNAENAGMLRDLEPPSISTNDQLERWELSQPFARATIMAYMHCLNLAHQASGDNGYVMLEHLSAQFNTPAWNALRKSESKFSKFLMTSLKHESGKGVDYEMMVCMGILHCQDKAKPTTKANALYELLQDGGAEKQTHICSSDKDWKPITAKLFTAATIAANDGCDTTFYDPSDCDKFKASFAEVAGMDEEENSLIDDLFGVDSKKSYEQYIEQMSTAGRRWFSAKDIRKRVHDVSGV